MQKLIWGFFLALFVLDILKVNLGPKELPKVNPVEAVEEQVTAPVVETPKAKREYSGDKIIVEIGYWYILLI
jgi:hypothetical protein